MAGNSQGGIIIRSLMKYCPIAQKYAKRIFFFGTPHMGIEALPAEIKIIGQHYLKIPKNNIDYITDSWKNLDKTYNPLKKLDGNKLK